MFVNCSPASSNLDETFMCLVLAPEDDAFEVSEVCAASQKDHEYRHQEAGKLGVCLKGLARRAPCRLR